MREYLYKLANDKINTFASTIFKNILFLFSVIYCLIVKLTILCYRFGIFRRYKLNCKVISVGNITWGGTGKTPAVEMIALKLLENGHKVAIQSRGYKRKRMTQNYELKNPNYRTMGDEPFMLQDNLKKIPVLVGVQRLNSANQAIDKFNLDTVILDDGFQHWRIFRDLDIVVIDCLNPFGNSFLIPRGILREPLSGLKRADIFLLTHSDLVDDSNLLKRRLKEINHNAEIFDSVHYSNGFYNILDNEKKLFDANLIMDRKLCMLTSIGNPDSFEKTLLNIGLNIALKFVFLDHHEFSQSDFSRIKSLCLKEKVFTIVTTQKDAVRLKDYYLYLEGFRVLVLRMEIKITENEDKFFNRLSSLYRR